MDVVVTSEEGEFGMDRTKICDCCNQHKSAGNFEPAFYNHKGVEICRLCIRTEFLYCYSCMMPVHKAELKRFSAGNFCVICYADAEFGGNGSWRDGTVIFEDMMTHLSATNLPATLNERS